MTPTQKAFLNRAYEAAKLAGHIFPEMAACECALESGYGASVLARTANNLFGCKRHAHEYYPTVSLPTKEDLDGKWVALNSSFIAYPDWAACFADRMETLKRLAPFYPHYKAALEATSAENYVEQVSQTWSTDPHRAQSCCQIYHEISSDWNANA
jgi:flagellum-specific peptidoglycan hydrolase FlgJ